MRQRRNEIEDGEGSSESDEERTDRATDGDFALDRTRISQEKLQQDFRRDVIEVLNRYLRDKRYAFAREHSDNAEPEIGDVVIDGVNGTYTAIIHGLDNVDYAAYKRDVKRALGPQYSFRQEMMNTQQYVNSIHTFRKEMTNCIVYTKSTRGSRLCTRVAIIAVLLLLVGMAYAMIVWTRALHGFVLAHETPFRHMYAAILLLGMQYAGIEK